MHAVVHVVVAAPDGQRLLLQKRSESKHVQPGKWDTSVGGHVDPGETFDQAARREMAEEIGLANVPVLHAYDHISRTRTETEYARTFVVRHNGPFRPNPEELSDLRFWPLPQIDAALGTEVFTPHFEQEYRLWAEWTGPEHIAQGGR